MREKDEKAGIEFENYLREVEKDLIEGVGEEGWKANKVYFVEEMVEFVKRWSKEKELKELLVGVYRIVEEAEELNMSNYEKEEVFKLNNSMIDIFTYLSNNKEKFMELK